MEHGDEVRLLSAMLALTLLIPTAASAFIEDPYIAPTHPNSSSRIAVRVRAGGCHAIADFPDEAELIEESPGQLRLITDGVALPPGHPFCIYPAFTYQLDIGSLRSGTYSLRVFIFDSFSSPDPQGFGSVTFTVAPAATIPASSIPALATMALVLLSTPVIGYRFRR